MEDVERFWRAKSDDEVARAAEQLDNYSDDGKRILRSELRRRGLAEPSSSGQGGRTGQASAEAVSQFNQSGLAIPREAGAVIGIIGFVLLVLGALRWNSMESQFTRAFGETDGLGITLLFAGGAGLAFGGYVFFSPRTVSTAAPAPPDAVPSIEARLRQLDDLRSKNLISDAQYEERKRNIIASI
jgi:hypothetical protein